jgi:hypothetical protein
MKVNKASIVISKYEIHDLYHLIKNKIRGPYGFRSFENWLDSIADIYHRWKGEYVCMVFDEYEVHALYDILCIAEPSVESQRVVLIFLMDGLADILEDWKNDEDTFDKDDIMGSEYCEVPF